MTFYNPMFPFFPPNFPHKFSHQAKPFNHNNFGHSNLEYSNKKNQIFPETSENNTVFQSNASESSKSKKKVFLNNYLFDNLFSEIQESDTLILLCLIYLLYLQQNNDLIIYILFLILIS